MNTIPTANHTSNFLQFPVVLRQVISTSPKFSLLSITNINEHGPLLSSYNDTPPSSPYDNEFLLLMNSSSHDNVSAL